MDLKFSWPAVSQIWSLSIFLLILMVLAANSTPMVTSCSSFIFCSTNCWTTQDLPTPRLLLEYLCLLWLWIWTNNGKYSSNFYKRISLTPIQTKLPLMSKILIERNHISTIYNIISRSHLSAQSVQVIIRILLFPAEHHFRGIVQLTIWNVVYHSHWIKTLTAP